MLKWGGCTDLGCTRPINEDGYYISQYSEEFDALYAIVTDGMGGHKAGEVASTMAIKQVSDMLNQNFCGTMEQTELKELLVKALKTANRAIYDASVHKKECVGMGTTITLCFLRGNQAVVAHVGDSRAYILRDGAIHQITTDHSLVHELVKNGQITEEEAICHPQKNVITRALGTEPGVEIDVYEFKVVPGDMLLLCSDGLSNMVQDEELKQIMEEGRQNSLTAVADTMIQLAKERGGYDNITAVLLTK